jgi:hypothetical protein
MAEHICWGELVGELSHVLARVKKMKKLQRNAEVWWEVDELSHSQKEYYLDPNNEGYKNFIHDKTYTTKADLYRVRFFGPKMRVDARKSPEKKATNTKVEDVATREPRVSDFRCAEHTGHVRTVCKWCDLEYMKWKYPEMYGNKKPEAAVESNFNKFASKTWDVTKLEAVNRALIPTAEEQRDVRENGMLGAGTRDHFVMYVSANGVVSKSDNVTFTEALHLARHAKDCIAYVTKLVQAVDSRKTPLERARDRVNMVLQNFRNESNPDEKELLDLHAAVNAWKEVALTSERPASR